MPLGTTSAVVEWAQDPLTYFENLSTIIPVHVPAGDTAVELFVLPPVLPRCPLRRDLPRLAEMVEEVHGHCSVGLLDHGLPVSQFGGFAVPGNKSAKERSTKGVSHLFHLRRIPAMLILVLSA